MKKLFGTVGFRIGVLAVSVLLQIGFYIVLFVFLSKYRFIFNVFCLLLAAAAVLSIVVKDTNPDYKIAWIIPILLFPIVGGIFYLIFGHARINRREAARIDSVKERYETITSGEESVLPDLKKESWTAAFQAQYLETSATAPLCSGTQTEYFPLGEDLFASMTLELKKAKRFIFLEYFIISDGIMWRTILKILEEKVREGVDVRLIYDDLGCLLHLPADFCAQMEAKGIRCCVFNRFRHIFNSRFNNRDHRKICVIDGNVGYTGGINLADEYINAIQRFGHWKDTGILLRGTAVYSLTCMFLSLWDVIRDENDDFRAFAPTEAVPSAPGFVQPFSAAPSGTETVGETMYINILNKAQDYVYIMTPYLIIDHTMITALSIAAKSGVDVRIITPGIPDKKIVYQLTRSYYRVLLEAGIRIYEYTPGFLHAKSFVSDDTTAVVGTINLDYRSLYLHYECATWMYQTDCVSALKEDFLDTVQRSREITLQGMKQLPLWRRALLALLRIFAPLM